MRLAITGGTGFVGGHLLRMAADAGHEVRALTRRPQPGRDGVVWIEGALDRPDSLARLVAGVDAVVHVAGVIAGDTAAFHTGNVLGTEAIAAATAHAGIARFVHVSSLVAREPGLSAYGRSKRDSEIAVIAGIRNWTILRPPAFYGAGERDVLELFRMAKRGIVPLPTGGRLSVIGVEDFTRLILACLASDDAIGRTYEPDDGRPGGWSTAEFARAIGAAVGRRVLTLPIPQPLMRLGATLDGLLRGPRARLTPDRVAYFYHPDWTASPAAHPPATLWHAATDTREGLAATAAWYRAQGWL